MIDHVRRSRASLAGAITAVLVAIGAVTTVGAPAAGAADSNSLTVKAGEYTYKLSGSPKSGYTQVTLQNDGIEYHMLAIQPLKKGVTLKQLKATLASDDESDDNAISGKGDVVSIPNFLGPGQATTVITKLPAGHYGLMCFVPAPDGQPHVAHGMVKLLDVSSSKSSLTLPKDGLVPVTIADDSITLPASGVPAKGWVKVTNGSSTTRDLTLAHYLTPSATFDDGTAYFNEFFQTGKLPDGPAPAAILGGVAQIPGGGTGYMQLNLKPGRYVFISDTEDDQDGSAQVHQDFTVK